MAINETTMNRRDVAQPLDPTMRRPLFPAIRWGAVIAGVAVGISVQLVLTLLGIATGLSTVNITQGETIGTGPLLWAGFSMLVSAFVGGYVAARMSGLKRRADGVLHGAVSWAVTTIMFAVLATSIGGTLVSGVFNNMSQLARASAPSGESALAALMRSQGGRMMDADTLRQFQQYLRAGQREQAIQLVTGSMGLDQGKASTIVDQALILTGSPGAASPESRATTENAMHTAGKAAWIGVVGIALALAIGIGGGLLGAASARRIIWSGGATPARS